MRSSLLPLGAALLVSAMVPAWGQGVLDVWGEVKPPPPPPLARVTPEPKTTALLVLDLAAQTCDPKTRPRCVAMLPHVATLIAKAREKQWTVIYTLGAASKEADIMPQVARRDDEPVFTGPPNKFVGTTLEAALKQRGIKTVVTVGAAAEGAVMETAADAAFRGFDVVIPVDGMASATLYGEQYTAWDLVNAPRVSDRAKLSAIGMIE